MTISTLRTARLLLRAPTVDDAPVVAASLDNFEISKWLTVVPHPYTQADAQWFIDENLAGRFKARLLWSGDRFIGVMGIDGELGYWLDQAAWGQGFATEAGRAVVADFFATQDQEYLCSSYFSENNASGNVLTKLGFVADAPNVHFSKARGENVPGCGVKLTRARHDALSRAQQ